MNAVSTPEPCGDHAEAHEGLEVELQASEEDQVEDADAADRLQAGESWEHVEHVRTDDGAERQQSEQAREAHALGNDRPEDDDETHHREPERWARLHHIPVHRPTLRTRHARRRCSRQG
jgi:hypothetical protein